MNMSKKEYLCVTLSFFFVIMILAVIFRSDYHELYSGKVIIYSIRFFGTFYYPVIIYIISGFTFILLDKHTKTLVSKNQR